MSFCGCAKIIDGIMFFGQCYAHNQWTFINVLFHSRITCKKCKKILTTFSSEASIEKRRCSSNATLVHKGNFREIAKKAKRNSDVREPWHYIEMYVTLMTRIKWGFVTECTPWQEMKFCFISESEAVESPSPFLCGIEPRNENVINWIFATSYSKCFWTAFFLGET